MKDWLDKVSRKLANLHIVKRIYPTWSLRQQQDVWNNRWANPNFSTAWLLAAPPQEVRDAVQSKWFPPETRVLDIGCGSGEISAWLAIQGFQVLGIDFADHAIRRAKIKHKNAKGNLSWQVVDICRETPGETPFEVLIDRGCLHGIPADMVSFYVKHTAACSTPGARFLLLHKTMPITSDASTLTAKNRSVTDLIETHFQPAFEILQISPTILLRSSGDSPKEPMAGLSVRMLRR